MLHVPHEINQLPVPYRIIYRYLKKEGIEKRWVDIANATKMNPNTARVYLRNLFHRRFIENPRRGFYRVSPDVVTNSTLGVGKLGPRVHNLYVRGKYTKGNSTELDFGDDVFKATITCHKNQWCSIRVKCPYGLDLVSWKLVFNWICSNVEFEKEDEVSVVSYELLNDFRKMQLEGCSCLTLKTFDGSFERLYNKEYGLRSEVKPFKNVGVTPEAVFALLKGGQTAYNLVQMGYMQVQEISRLVDAVKYGNYDNARIAKYVGQCANAFNRMWNERQQHIAQTKSLADDLKLLRDGKFIETDPIS